MSRGSPLVDVELAFAPITVGSGREIWRLSGEVALPAAVLAYDQRLTRVDGAFLLDAGAARLLIEPAEGRVTVDAHNETAALQLVTTMALPMLLERAPALALHACAAIAPGRTAATVVCGRAGTGKSSLLVGLLDAGWLAVSEDVCVVDLRDSTPVVWPGPPWVRRAGPGPADSSLARFETPDKVAWDIASRQAIDPAPVAEILFLEPAGGERTEEETLSAADAIRRLTWSTIWLTDPDDRAPATFHRIAGLSKAMRCGRVRFPVSDDWVREAVAVLARGADPPAAL